MKNAANNWPHGPLVHMPPQVMGGANPPPASMPVPWPPAVPSQQQMIPAHLLRLPDLVAEKLRLCGIIVTYVTNSDEYQLVIVVPHYVRMSIKHDAPAELWEQAMKYLVERANRPASPYQDPSGALK